MEMEIGLLDKEGLEEDLMFTYVAWPVCSQIRHP